MKIVTRFPPSPSGHLHIGGARTALFNWALARSTGGSFYLRFEDTDRARSSLESEQSMLEALEWLGIDHDPVPGFDGIPHQSQRTARYLEQVEHLLETGRAYRCTCTPDQVEAMRVRAREQGGQPRYDGTCRERGIPASTSEPYCVRLRVDPDRTTRWSDLVAGPSGQDATLIDDFVLQRTDGSPIYHLAVVVDDHDMGVTHVLRGREHMLNTSRQLLLYDALGFAPPAFGHVPLLVDAKGKKLSKRVGDVSVQAYRDRGYTPEALANFIARLGWSRGDLEIVSMEQLSQVFRIEDIGKSPSQVDEDKLGWLNQQYIKSLPGDQLLRYARPFLEAEAGRSLEDGPTLRLLIDVLRERSKTLVELASRARFCLVDQIELDPKATRKFLKPEARAPLMALRAALAALDPKKWRAAELEPVLQAVVEQQGLSMGQLAQPTRVAVVGSAASPGIFQTLELVGAERTLQRIDAALSAIPA